MLSPLNKLTDHNLVWSQKSTSILRCFGVFYSSATLLRKKQSKVKCSYLF